jgi:hypothetical protein
MKTTNPLDAARIELPPSELRLPAIKLIWAKLAEQSDKEGWPAARFLAVLAEYEIAEGNRCRLGFSKAARRVLKTIKNGSGRLAWHCRSAILEGAAPRPEATWACDRARARSRRWRSPFWQAIEEA